MKRPRTYHTYAFGTQRRTPILGLPRHGSVEIILPGRPSVASQQRAARIIRRSPHDLPLVSLCPLHPATRARRLTTEQCARYERACQPLS